MDSGAKTVMNKSERRTKEQFDFLLYQSAEENVSVNALINNCFQNGNSSARGQTSGGLLFAGRYYFSRISRQFKKSDTFSVQNKFHYAITKHTAAEFIYKNADHEKEHMGLTTWKNAPEGRILKSDVEIAKNYLDEKQIRQLERAVTGYFDYIEDLIERENTFTMEEFSTSVNEFLAFRRYEVLPDHSKGRISSQEALEKAHKEYDIFNRTQVICSDFDKEVKKLLECEI